MARRTAALKPQLNQIRTWARDGRTDAWIAFQLGTTAATVQEFRSEHGLDKGGGNPAEEPVTPELVVQTISFDTPPPVGRSRAGERRAGRGARVDPHAPPAAQPVDGRRRGGHDARARGCDPGRRPRPTRPRRATASRPSARSAGRRRGGRGAGAATGEAAAASDAATAAEPVAAEKPARASSKRRPRTPASYEGSVVAGAVIVLDPAVARSAAWRAHWADGPAFDVVIDDEQIVLRRRTV